MFFWAKIECNHIEVRMENYFSCFKERRHCFTFCKMKYCIYNKCWACFLFCFKSKRTCKSTINTAFKPSWWMTEQISAVINSLQYFFRDLYCILSLHGELFNLNSCRVFGQEHLLHTACDWSHFSSCKTMIIHTRGPGLCSLYRHQWEVWTG